MSLVVICCPEILIDAPALRRLYSCPISSSAASKGAAICQTLSASHPVRF
jgi:hypothetical protein